MLALAAAVATAVAANAAAVAIDDRVADDHDVRADADANNAHDPRAAAALQRVLAGVVEQQTAALVAARGRDAVHEAAVRVVVEDVDRGVRADVGGDVDVYLASSIKLFVVLEAFRQREAGTLRFDEEVPYGEDDVRDGAPSLNRLPVGARFRVSELLTFMVRDSDNAAFDLLLRRLTPAAVEAGASRFGRIGRVLSTLDTRRSVYALLDPRAAHLDALAIRDVRWRDGFHPRLDLLKKHIGPPYGRYNGHDLDVAWAKHYATGASSAPLNTVANALVALARGRAVSPSADAEILSLLRHTKTSEHRLLGDLPVGTPVAHKTGSLHKRIADVGVITLDDADGGGALVVAVAVSGPGVDVSEAAVAAVARAAFDAVRDMRRITPATPAKPR